MQIFPKFMVAQLCEILYALTALIKDSLKFWVQMNSHICQLNLSICLWILHYYLFHVYFLLSVKTLVLFFFWDPSIFIGKAVRPRERRDKDPTSAGSFHKWPQNPELSWADLKTGARNIPHMQGPKTLSHLALLSHAIRSWMGSGTRSSKLMKSWGFSH